MVSPFPELATIPSVYEFVRHLESRGIPVSLFVPGPPERAMGVESNGITTWGQFPSWHPHGLWRFFSQESYIGLFGLRKKFKQRWSCIVALNGLGLGNAQLVNRWLGLPVWYWSLELLFDDELARYPGPFARWRQMEKMYLPSCAGGIIQDENKAQAFVRENPCFQNKPMLLLPNTLTGPARRAKKWRFHEQFGLSRTTRVALYSGSFSACNRVDDIALSISSWPSDWVLVIHSRHPVGGGGNLLFAKKLLEKVCAPGRLFFTSSPLTPEELPDMIDSADLGIAFYGVDEALVLSRRNNELMGYSSGKVNSYVQAGLPVIVNDYTSMSAWVASSGCGKVVHDTSQIGDAIRDMEGDLDGYSARAVAFYNRNLCIDEQISKVADRILGVRGKIG